jgi:Tol biopolymer transport system component
VEASNKLDRQAAVDTRFAWLTLFFAAWILGGLNLFVWAITHGQTSDIGFSPYHVPFYLGLATLAGVLAWRVIHAVRSGRSWHEALPPGYGVVGAGLITLLAWPVVDLGWREGVGTTGGLAEFLGPHRLLIPIGLTLISVAPLRFALGSAGTVGARWPAVASGALVFAIVSGPGGFLPAFTPYLEVPTNGPEDDSEIWVMNADGSRQTRLIEAADGFEFGPAVWSPDETQIAFIRVKSPAQMVVVDDIEIWLAAADGTNQRPLVTGTGWHWIPHWSPDGQWIVYTVDGQRGPGRSGLGAPDTGFNQPPAAGQPPAVAPGVEVDVWRVRADGTGQPERLTDSPADDRAGVNSPDGRHLLFDSTREGGRTGIYVMDADGSNVVRVTFMGDDWGGSWSPDGTQIVFNSSPTGGPTDLYVTSFPVTGEPRQLTTDPVGDVGPSWSPDGSRIAFTVALDDGADIWSIASDGTDPRNLTRTPGVSEYLALGGGAWNSDGRILYQRSGVAAARTAPLVRENLAVAGAILEALLLAVVVLAVVRVGAPFGTVAVILGLATFVVVIPNGEWRFIPAAMIMGLLVDILMRLAPARFKPGIAGAGAAAALVLASGLTIMTTTVLAWSPTLLLGVTLASAAVGWGLSGLIVPSMQRQMRIADE